jgi:hypothetical protein
LHASVHICMVMKMLTVTIMDIWKGTAASYLCGYASWRFHQSFHRMIGSTAFPERFILTVYRSDAISVPLRSQVAGGFGRPGVPRDIRVCLQIHMVSNTA